MNTPRGRRCCIVRSCKSRLIDKNIHFFRIPKEHPRAIAWLQASNRMDLRDKSGIDLHKYYKICSLHFKKCMFTSPEENELLLTAAPTEFDNIKANSCKTPPPDDSAKKLKTTHKESTEINITPDHTYHKMVNTKVQEELDKLTSSLTDFRPAILKPAVSKPRPSILKPVPIKPIETIDLTTTPDPEPITKRQPEIHKITQGSKSYLLIPKEFLRTGFTRAPGQHTILIPTSLLAPQDCAKNVPEPPKQTVNSTSSILEPPKKTSIPTSFIPAPSRYVSNPPEPLNKTIDYQSIPAPSRYVSNPPEPPKKTINYQSTPASSRYNGDPPETPKKTIGYQSMPAPAHYMKYAPQPPKQQTNSSSSLLAPTASMTGLHGRSNKSDVTTQTTSALLSTLPRIMKQQNIIKSLNRKNKKTSKIIEY